MKQRKFDLYESCPYCDSNSLNTGGIGENMFWQSCSNCENRWDEEYTPRHCCGDSTVRETIDEWKARNVR